MIRTIIGCLVILVCIVGVVGCGESPCGMWEISVEEAEIILERAISYAEEHDLEGLCGMGGSSSICNIHWRSAGEWEGLPIEPPEIVDTYLLPTVDHGGGSQSTGGRILVLEGIDGLGNDYRTEFLVFCAGSHGLVPYSPIYWSGIGMKSGDSDGMGSTEGH